MVRLASVLLAFALMGQCQGAATLGEFAADAEGFAAAFAAAWRKLMASDLFVGPAKRRCWGEE